MFVGVVQACIALAVAALVFGAGWSVNGYRLGEQIAELKREQAQAITKGVKDALETTTALQAKKDRALAAANVRGHALSAAVDNAAAESNRLRDELSRADARIAQAADAAVRDYAVAANAVFADCSRQYQNMAAKADGHASDVRTLIEAWPEGGKP